jgi:speckle-type POZ protein
MTKSTSPVTLSALWETTTRRLPRSILFAARAIPEPLFGSDTSCWGYKDYPKRTDVLENYLDRDGSLLIEVEILNAVETEVVWYPQLNNMPNDVLVRLYDSSFAEGKDGEDEDSTADVVFDVGGMEFYAHENILSLHAKTIYELVKDHNKNDNGNTVPTQDIEDFIFEIVLEFIYCVRTPEIKDKDIAIKLLLAADRLGCTDLKLYVESKIVDNFLDASNVAEWLVRSDSHSCPLLKEASMKYMHPMPVLYWSLKGGLKSRNHLVSLRNFSSSVRANHLQRRTAIEQRKTISTILLRFLNVTSLRKRLLDANLNIDGNREILVDRFKHHYSSRG